MTHNWQVAENPQATGRWCLRVDDDQISRDPGLDPSPHSAVESWSVEASRSGIEGSYQYKMASPLPAALAQELQVLVHPTVEHLYGLYGLIVGRTVTDGLVLGVEVGP